MAATVKISEIVDALSMMFDEMPQFLDLDTGEVWPIHAELLSEVEEYEDDEMPDLPEWQKEEWEVAKRITFTDRFERLPSKFDVHEWEIMEEFASSVESARIREELLNAIHGRGAFRMFKDSVHRHGIEKVWYQFRDDALRQIAIDWCEEHQIPWQSDEGDESAAGSE
jgi:hypothetical protein